MVGSKCTRFIDMTTEGFGLLVPCPAAGRSALSARDTLHSRSGSFYPRRRLIGSWAPMENDGENDRWRVG